MSRTNEAWIEHQTGTPEARREYEQERLVLWVTDTLCEVMEASGMTKADLARELGTSRSNITQLLSGSRNMTLRTLSDICWALGRRADLKLEKLREGAFVDAPAKLVKVMKPEFSIRIENGEAAAEPADVDPFAA